MPCNAFQKVQYGCQVFFVKFHLLELQMKPFRKPNIILCYIFIEVQWLLFQSVRPMTDDLKEDVWYAFGNCKGGPYSLLVLVESAFLTLWRLYNNKGFEKKVRTGTNWNGDLTLLLVFFIRPLRASHHVLQRIIGFCSLEDGQGEGIHDNVLSHLRRITISIACLSRISVVEPLSHQRYVSTHELWCICLYYVEGRLWLSCRFPDKFWHHFPTNLSVNDHRNRNCNCSFFGHARLLAIFDSRAESIPLSFYITALLTTTLIVVLSSLCL